MTIARVLLAIVLAGFGLAVWGIHRDIGSLSAGMSNVATLVGSQLGTLHSKLSDASDKLDKTYKLTHGMATIHQAKKPPPVRHLLPHHKAKQMIIPQPPVALDFFGNPLTK